MLFSSSTLLESWDLRTDESGKRLERVWRALHLRRGNGILVRGGQLSWDWYVACPLRVDGVRLRAHHLSHVISTYNACVVSSAHKHRIEEWVVRVKFRLLDCSLARVDLEGFC